MTTQPEVAPEGAHHHPVSSDGEGAQHVGEANGKPTEPKAERDGVVAPTSGWRDIVSCPTDMADEVELKLPDGSTCIGMFSWPSGQWRRWVGEVPSARVEDAVMRVFSPLPKDVYPTHWRPKSTPSSERLSSDRAGGAE